MQSVSRVVPAVCQSMQGIIRLAQTGRQNRLRLKLLGVTMANSPRSKRSKKTKHIEACSRAPELFSPNIRPVGAVALISGTVLVRSERTVVGLAFKKLVANGAPENIGRATG